MPTEFEMRRLVSEKAAEWYIRFEDDDLNAAERKELLQWIETPSNCDEFIHIARVDAMVRGRKLADCYRPRSVANRSNRPTRWMAPKAAIVAIALALLLPALGMVTAASQSILTRSSVASPAGWSGTSFVIPQESTSNGIVIASDSAKFVSVVRAIERDPRVIHELSWRQWEEIVAAGWECFGYRVELTPPSRDGGRDLIATSTQGAAVRILDQVKKRAAHSTVSQDDVRAMLGVLSMYHNVSKAFVTTTSDFAPGVYRDQPIQQFVPYRLELRSRVPLLSWLSRACDILTGRKMLGP